MLFRSGEQIGPYVLVRELGRGAFGSVWLAQEQSLLEREVAIKLPLEEDPDMEVIKREAKTWLRVGNHPNLVPVLNAGVYDGQVAIASEYVSGGTLTQWLRRNQGQAHSIEAAIAMIGGILSGLDHLHHLRPQPLIHRDLKPANVLLEEETETPRITDFGVSRVLKSTASTNISGTPSYMAPEMFEGHYSAQSDLWAAGIMLYQMLTGRLPFQAENMMQLARIIERQPPEPLPETLPRSLRDTLEQALQKDPTQRFGSAKEMREALQSDASPRSKLIVQSVVKTPFAPFEDLAPTGAKSALPSVPEQPSGENPLPDEPSIPVLPASAPVFPSAPSLSDTSRPIAPSPARSPSDAMPVVPAPVKGVTEAAPRPSGKVQVYVGLAALAVLGGGLYVYHTTHSAPPDRSNTEKGSKTGSVGLTPEQYAAQEQQRRDQEARANKERADRAEAERLAGKTRASVDRADSLIQQKTMRTEAERACRQSLRLSEEALKLDRKNLVAWRSRAAAYYDLEEFKKAKQAVQEGLLVDPKDDWLNRLLNKLK